MVKPGDSVKAEDALVTLESDKATMDVPAPLSGKVQEMKVKVDARGAVVRITKEMDPAEASGEYIGATLVEPEAVPLLVESLEATWRRDPGLYYEDAFQDLVDRGQEVMAAAIPWGTRWVEVDDSVDLARAREIACHY